jgi:broad specificity phosphatase PhoE
MEQMGQILLVRHGQASFGSADYDRLSELGAEQARLLGAWFAETGQGFSRVICGDMLRQCQSADACLEVLAAATQVPRAIDRGFNEYDHHEVLVRLRPEFEDPDAMRRYLAASPNPRAAFQDVFAAAMSRWMSGQYDADYGETWSAFQRRCMDALLRLTESGERGQSIAVFTSGGVIAALCQHVLGMGDRETARLNWGLVNSGVTRLLFQSRPGRPTQLSLNYLNNHAHLERLGRPHAITYR